MRISSVRAFASRFACVIIAFSMLLSLCLPASAADSHVDLNKLMKETQKLSQEQDNVKLIWWIPEEYWRVSFASNSNIPKSQVDDFLSMLRPYTVFCIVSGRLGLMGLVSYESEADLKASVMLMDSKGNEYPPLKDEQIGSVTKNLLTIMKPVFSNILGSMGENMHFILFPDLGKDNKMIANAKREGSFTIRVTGEDFTWRLPLGALLPMKTCPKCKEELSGTYKFCPYDGEKL